MILEGTLEVGDLMKYINGYKVEESLYTKYGKQIYMRNLRLFLMNSPKGAEKEPKESYNYSNAAYGNNEFNKKTGTKGYERIAGRRRTYKRRD